MRTSIALAGLTLAALMPAACGGDEGSGATGSGDAEAALLPNGAACAADNECAGAVCLDEIGAGWPSGACATPCSAEGACIKGEMCVVTSSGEDLCITACDPAAPDCRDGYSCLSGGDGAAGVCSPQCSTDAACVATGTCDVASGACVAAEDCGDALDNDADGRPDCEDLDCAAACGEAVEATCGAAAEAASSSSGDTTGGSDLFSGTCAGSGAPERVYAYLSPDNGAATLTLESEADLALYARSVCGDPATERGCSDELGGGMIETLTVAVAKGEAIALFVDGYEGAGEAGSFTLSIAFHPSVCGDGIVTPPEACDDGNTTDGDGCSATCGVN